MQRAETRAPNHARRKAQLPTNVDMGIGARPVPAGGDSGGVVLPGPAVGLR